MVYPPTPFAYKLIWTFSQKEPAPLEPEEDHLFRLYQCVSSHPPEKTPPTRTLSVLVMRVDAVHFMLLVGGHNASFFVFVIWLVGFQVTNFWMISPRQLRRKCEFQAIMKMLLSA
jgi:hypothetical protein